MALFIFRIGAAAQQRLWVALQAVGEAAQRVGGAVDLFHHLLQVLLHGCIGCRDLRGKPFDQGLHLVQGLRELNTDLAFQGRHQFVETLERAGQVAGHVAQRQRIELADDVGDLDLNLVKAAGHARDLQPVGVLGELLVLRRQHVERDIELSGDQVAGAQLRAQAALNEAANQPVTGFGR